MRERQGSDVEGAEQGVDVVGEEVRVLENPEHRQVDGDGKREQRRSLGR